MDEYIQVGAGLTDDQIKDVLNKDEGKLLFPLAQHDARARSTRRPSIMFATCSNVEREITGDETIITIDYHYLWYSPEGCSATHSDDQDDTVAASYEGDTLVCDVPEVRTTVEEF